MKNKFKIMEIIPFMIVLSSCTGDIKDSPESSSDSADTSSKNSSDSNSDSENPSSSFEVGKQVENHKLKEGVLYSGYLDPKGRPDDEKGKLAYSDGTTFQGKIVQGSVKEGTLIDGATLSTFVGTLTSDDDYNLSKTKGKLTYANGSFYEGKFVDNLFEDENGVFSSHTVDSEGHKTYSYLYEGAFVKGSVSNQRGKLFFPMYFTNEQGIWYAIGLMEKENTIKADQDLVFKCRYEAAYYEGEGHYDGHSYFPKGKGKTVFDNTCRYEGEYKDGNYDGKGEFHWPDHTWYEGDFSKGSPNGCQGTIHYPCETTKTEGVWYFSSLMSGFVAPALNQSGHGKILFGDKSFYEGDIYYDGGFWRYGQGIQDFSGANYDGSLFGGPKGTIADRYVGSFDYHVSQWIFGNGVMYYKNPDGSPAGYSKGYWYGLNRISDYKGVFNKDVLLEEYKDSQEITYVFNPDRVSHYNAMYKDKANTDILFAGDSYLEMWRKEFKIVNYEENFEASYDSINVAIGGTVFNQWQSAYAEKMAFSHSANRIVIHLGFNDLHMGLSAEDTLANCQAFISLLHEKYPSASLYLLTVEPSPTFRSFLAEEKKYNSSVKEAYAGSSYIKVVDTASLFMNGDEPLADLSSHFIEDRVHLNAKGYNIWTNAIKAALSL